MQATERGRTVRDTARSTLDPARLFDLLADPIERQKWDLCPSYIQQDPMEAAPGPALEGASFTVRGTARGIRFVGTAVVTAAERPRRYQTRSETTFERAYPDAAAIDEFVIEPDGSGSLVHYSATIIKVPGTGATLLGLFSALLEPLLVPGAVKRNFRNTLRYAEKHAEVTA
jgi:polyketide cyclase/dehydrase/lipid transport protein